MSRLPTGVSMEWWWAVKASSVRRPAGVTCRPGGRPGLGAAAEQVGVEARAGADLPAPRASVAEVQRDAVFGLAGQDDDGRVDLAAVERQGDDVLGGELQPLGGRRSDQRGVLPGQLGQGLRQLLQPSVVGELAVEDRGIGAEERDQRRVVVRRGLGVERRQQRRRGLESPSAAARCRRRRRRGASGARSGRSRRQRPGPSSSP